jgi:hypothetical protein
MLVVVKMKHFSALKHLKAKIRRIVRMLMSQIPMKLYQRDHKKIATGD